MKTRDRNRSLLCLLLVGSAACASAEPVRPTDLAPPRADSSIPSVCPPCGAGMVCDAASGTCVPEGSLPTCTPACGANAVCSASSTCVCGPGYKDCNGDTGDGCECQGECGAGGSCGGAPPTGCDPACADGQVCDSSGRCIAAPPPGPDAAMALLQLRRLVQASEPKTLGEDGQGAQERARFHDYEALPADSRQTYQTSDSEACTYEAGTTLYGTGWPSTPTVGAGDITFTVAGAPGPIVLLAKNYSGWAYIRDQPDGLKSGSTTNASWFSTDYVPYAAKFTVATAGGPDLGPLSFSGEVPESFTITGPRAAEVDSTPTGDLTVTWSPAQPAAKMELRLVQTSGTSGYTKRLSCAVKDDGSTTIPEAVTSQFPGKVFLEMHRTVERFDKATDAQSGREVHTTIVGKVEHHLWFQFQ